MDPEQSSLMSEGKSEGKDHKEDDDEDELGEADLKVKHNTSEKVELATRRLMLVLYLVPVLFVVCEVV